MPLLFDPATPGLRKPHVAHQDLEPRRWMFSVVFDYGEGHCREEEPDADGRIFAHVDLEPAPLAGPPRSFLVFPLRLRGANLSVMPARPDVPPFPGGTGQRKITSFAQPRSHIDEKPIGSFIERVVQSGHKRQPDGRYLTRSLPPLDLGYTASPLEDPDPRLPVRDVDAESLGNLPGGIDGAAIACSISMAKASPAC